MKSRDNGIFARLSSTPMTKLHFLLGMWLPNLIVVLVQVGVLLGLGSLMYKVNLGNLLAIGALAVSPGLCATGIRLAVSFVSKSENTAMGATQIFTLGGAVLGGLWFPLSLMPDTLQKIARIVPQYWAQQGFQDVMVCGTTLTTIWQSLTVLLGYAALGLIISSLTYNKFLQSAKSRYKAIRSLRFILW